MRVAVTGATGAIGAALLRAAGELNIERVGLARSEPEARAAEMWHSCDLLRAADPGFSQLSPTHLVHAAWVTKHPEYWSSPDNFLWQAASLSLLEAFAAAGGQHFTFIGTCAEYDWSTKARAGDPVAGYPKTLYGASKLLTTQMLARRAQELGVGFTCCRLFFPYSAQEPPQRIISQVIDSLLRGDAFHLRAGDVFRDIYSANGAAKLIMQLTLEGRDGVFDVSSGKETHLGQFLKENIGGALGKEDHLSWDDYVPAQEDAESNPRRLIGNATLLAPFALPSVIDTEEIDRLIANRKRLSGL